MTSVTGGGGGASLITSRRYSRNGGSTHALSVSKHAIVAIAIANRLRAMEELSAVIAISAADVSYGFNLFRTMSKTQRPTFR